LRNRMDSVRPISCKWLFSWPAPLKTVIKLGFKAHLLPLFLRGQKLLSQKSPRTRSLKRHDCYASDIPCRQPTHDHHPYKHDNVACRTGMKTSQWTFCERGPSTWFNPESLSVGKANFDGKSPVVEYRLSFNFLKQKRKANFNKQEIIWIHST
jgi:hypothetical protein